MEDDASQQHTSGTDKESDKDSENSLPGPFRRDFWRSPVRGPWLASVFSLVLLIGIPIVFLTGLISHAAWNPELGGTNNQTPGKGILGFYLRFIEWPTRPLWLYRVNNGVHLLLGLALVPVVLAKLWAVMPALFKWPPADSLAEGIERLAHIFLIGGLFWLVFTGLFFIQNWVIFTDTFNALHFYGAWIFMAGFALHAAVKLPRMVRVLRSRSLRRELRTSLAGTRPEPPDEQGLVTTNPAPATISRRGVLALVGGTSLAIVLLGIGQTLGQRYRWLAILSPRAQVPGDGPLGFRVNKTFQRAGIDPELVGPNWRLEIVGTRTLTFSRDELLAMQQHTSSIPIACLEGWSTGHQLWWGLRLRDLAAMSGVPNPGRMRIDSLEPEGRTRYGFMRGNQVLDPLSLLALGVNGVHLDLDHGYPARVIVPASVGNRNLKWVHRLTFTET